MCFEGEELGDSKDLARLAASESLSHIFVLSIVVIVCLFAGWRVVEMFIPWDLLWTWLVGICLSSAAKAIEHDDGSASRLTNEELPSAVRDIWVTPLSTEDSRDPFGLVDLV